MSGNDTLAEALRDSGVGAATILGVVSPWLDRHIEATMMTLERAEPNLMAMLDIRAELRVLRRFRRDMLSKVEAAKKAASGSSTGQNL